MAFRYRAALHQGSLDVYLTLKYNQSIFSDFNSFMKWIPFQSPKTQKVKSIKVMLIVWFRLRVYNYGPITNKRFPAIKYRGNNSLDYAPLAPISVCVVALINIYKGTMRKIDILKWHQFAELVSYAPRPWTADNLAVTTSSLSPLVSLVITQSTLRVPGILLTHRSRLEGQTENFFNQGQCV